MLGKTVMKRFRPALNVIAPLLLLLFTSELAAEEELQIDAAEAKEYIGRVALGVYPEF